MTAIYTVTSLNVHIIPRSSQMTQKIHAFTEITVPNCFWADLAVFFVLLPAFFFWGGGAMSEKLKQRNFPPQKIGSVFFPKSREAFLHQSNSSHETALWFKRICKINHANRPDQTNKTKQNKPKQNKPKQNQNKTNQNTTNQNKTKPKQNQTKQNQTNEQTNKQNS